MADEPMILTCRRAFPEAQAALESGGGAPFGDRLYTMGWVGTRVSSERGSFAVVALNGPLADLVGDIVRLTHGTKSVLAYVVGSADLPYEIGVTRRTFAAVELLSVDSVDVIVEVVT